MKRRKKNILTERLPATPCTPEMRERFLSIVDSEGKSIAEMQRTAFSLFLSSFASKADNIDSVTVKEQEQAS